MPLSVYIGSNLLPGEVYSMAQWLGHQSLAGELSLIYALSTVDMWPGRGYSVDCESTKQVNSAFHPSRVGKWIVIHVITWIMGMETVKRQTRAAYRSLVVGQSVGAGLANSL